jgi:TRAP-type mannitol/chloroaromatic compound transport system permease small subunit
MRSTVSVEPDRGVLHEDLPQRGPWGERLFQVSKAFALAGGMLFIALIVMSLVSIIGRKLFLMPVPGDIELMQMGTAVASAALLGYCEMEGKHLRVDFFTANLGERPKAVLDSIAHLLLGLVAALIAWRTTVAAISIQEAGETSMMLGWPVWPAIALIVPSMVVLALAGLYNAARQFAATARHEKSA